MQALILAGGEGTRLRPLTLTIPKPVVPLAGRPHLAHMIDWLRGHGVDDVILASGFMADGVRAVLGDGAELGVPLRYVEEPKPLGTGGALKFAADLLADRFLMLNGDVLTDIDLGAQLEQHDKTGARATLALVEVEDPSAYGLVRLSEDNAVQEFIEKPSPAETGTTPPLINAGVYVLERDVLEEVGPKGSPSSIEHDVFPRLIGRGLYGHPASGYWIDIGTPERYLQATFDLLDGRVATTLALAPDQTLVDPSAEVAESATVGPYAVLGPAVSVAAGARIERSVVLDHTAVGADSEISGAIVAPRARIGEHTRLEQDVVVGEGAVIEPGSVLSPGTRIVPGMLHGERAIRS